MCLICNSALSDDNKLSIQNNNYIVPHKSAAVLIPSSPLSSTSRLFLFWFLLPETTYIGIDMYVIVTCTSTSLKLSWWVRHLCCRPNLVDPHGRLKNNDIANFSILVSLNEGLRLFNSNLIFLINDFEKLLLTIFLIEDHYHCTYTCITLNKNKILFLSSKIYQIAYFII